jgi:DNA-directed RNA polymerase specialized sigma24 family protein
MGKARKFRVDFERDSESGDWTAVIDRSQGVSCVSQGRTISIARKRIRGALAVFLDDDKAAAQAELIENFVLPASAKSVLEKAVEARNALQEAARASAELSERAAKSLAKAGVSRRDAADILGVSHGRIQQLVREA